MSEQHKPTPTNTNTEKRGAFLDLTIAVGGAATYDVLKTDAKAGVQQVNDRLNGGDKSKD